MKAGKNARWIGLTLTVLLTVSACATPELTGLPDAPAPATAAMQSTQAPTEMPSRDAGPGEGESPISPMPTPAGGVISPLDTPRASQVDGSTTGMSGDWSADGIITDGEYVNQADFGDMRLWWRNDTDALYLAMEGDTIGWVAVGINPERGMQGANYLFGYVEDGEAKLWDAFGTAPTGPNHPADEELGGSNDIVTFTGIEDNGITRFEIQIPLDSGDIYDQALVAGQSYPIIIALGDTDDYNAYHRRYDRGELVLAPNP